MRKLIAAFLTLALVLSLAAPVFAAEPEKAQDTVILFTNDTHTYIDKSKNPMSFDSVAALKQQMAAEHESVLLVDAGDHAQGTAYGGMDKGQTIVKLMSAAGYDAATLGNHEFDYDMPGTMNLIDWAAYPYLSCNFYNEAAGVRGDNVLDSYKIFDIAGGKKLAIVGVTTPESITKSTPAYFQDENGNYLYGIAGGGDGKALYADVQKAIDEAKAAGADYVIGLGHLGVDSASSPWMSTEVIANVSGLNAFIDGHSHTEIPEYKDIKDDQGNVIGQEPENLYVTDKDGKDVLLAQTGSYFANIGKLTIAADGTVTAELVSGYEGSDAAVKALQDEWIAAIDQQLGEKIGSAEVVLDNYVLQEVDGTEKSVRLVRKQETNTGDFAADALYYLFDNMDMDVDVAVMNGGGVRNTAVTGDITYKTCKEIHAFGNVACLMSVTGQQLKDALEWGAKEVGAAENGGFLHVSGITYEIDATIPSTVQKNETGKIWLGSPTGEYRVKNIQVYNKETGAYEPLDLNAKYNLAGYNYTIRQGGDGFQMFNKEDLVLDYVMEDYLVLANYIGAFANKTVGAANSPLLAKYPGMKLDYATVNGSGRIGITLPEEEESDEIIIGGLDADVWMTKYGNVYMNCEVADFLKDYKLADIVTVKFLDQELELPVVPDYSYVDSGKPALIAKLNADGVPEGYMSMAINMGNFAQTYGIATKKTDENGDWYWVAQEGVTFPIVLKFEMAEEQGYAYEYMMHELKRTNNREDYKDLTDEEFANFRNIGTTGMGKNKLYRTSSPINPEIGRNTYADAAAKKAGITVIMNLADSKDSAAAYEGFDKTYYAGQKVIYLNLGVDFAAKDFQDGLAEGLRFFAENEGTYAVHCTEGKDRAGFVSALLECLMGATYDEVVADYMTSYENYYGVEKGSDKYNAIASSNIIKTLQTAFGVEDLSKADLAKEAEEYIKAIGLNDKEIKALKDNLNPPADIPATGDSTPVVVFAVLAVASVMGMAVLTSKKRA